MDKSICLFQSSLGGFSSLMTLKTPKGKLSMVSVWLIRVEQVETLNGKLALPKHFLLDTNLTLKFKFENNFRGNITIP